MGSQHSQFGGDKPPPRVGMDRRPETFVPWSSPEIKVRSIIKEYERGVESVTFNLCRVWRSEQGLFLVPAFNNDDVGVINGAQLNELFEYNISSFLLDQGQSDMDWSMGDHGHAQKLLGNLWSALEAGLSAHGIKVFASMLEAIGEFTKWRIEDVTERAIYHSQLDKSKILEELATNHDSFMGFVKKLFEIAENIITASNELDAAQQTSLELRSVFDIAPNGLFE